MAQVKDGRLVLAFCWAHVRRDFVRVGKGWPELKPWALVWLRRIRDLYQANRRRLDGPDEVAADQEVRRLVETMRQQSLAELADPTLRTPCRKALTSLQDHWDGLTRFVDDRRIPMDNNAMERRLRNPAVGRKNYYGSGAEWSGRLAAMLFSLLATRDLWGINPRSWLTEYLEAVHRKLGEVKDAKQVGWRVNATTAGTQVLLTYRTTFAEGRSVCYSWRSGAAHDDRLIVHLNRHFYATLDEASTAFDRVESI